MIDKIVASVDDAVADVVSGSSVAIGGFGRAGIPEALIDALCDRDIGDLHVISNNAGKDDRGIARLVREQRVRKITCSFPGTEDFQQQYRAGKIELELVPQGTLAERLRAGGAGLGGFYTRTSIGTLLANGGMPSRIGVDGADDELAAPKEVRLIDGREYVLELPLRPDVALVRADRADRYGNVRFRLSAQNFNPLCAMAAAQTIVEAAGVLHHECLPPDDVHLPGIFVDVVARAAGRTTPAPGGSR